MASVARKLLAQIKQLHDQPLEDIAQLSSDDPYEVNVILFGPAGTPYANGAFRIKLVYGSDYPSSPPKGYFSTKIYHPNVSLKGDICVNTLKRDWTAEVTISHILMIIKCLLINPGPDSALNEDAGRVLMDSYDEFTKMAKMWTSVHAIKMDKALSELDAEQLKALKLSCRSGDGVAATGILGNADVNKPGMHASEAQMDNAAKKIKTSDPAAKKKLDARKKTLKRL